MNTEAPACKPNGRALLPFLVFVAFYLGLSLQAGDSPMAIEAKLMVFIPQSERDALKSNKEG